jgi:uncharacterized membrane protein YphA (DoxX/SURF4 family)
MPLVMLHHCLRILLGLVFVRTGLIKLIDIPEFAHRLGDFGIVADSLVLAAAWLVSLTELVAGLGLAANVRGSLALVLCLLILFSGVVAYGIALGLDIDCGCLGLAVSLGLKPQLLIDVALLGWCGLVYWTGKRYKAKFDRPPAITLSISNLRGDAS